MHKAQTKKYKKNLEVLYIVLGMENKVARKS